MRQNLIKKSFVLIIVLVFIVVSIAPISVGENVNLSNEIEVESNQSIGNIDWWPMFHHDISRTGASTSSAPNTNNVLWKFKANNEYSIRGAVVVDDRVYCGSVGINMQFPGLTIGDRGGYVYCLDAESGDLIWEYKTRYGLHNEPAVVNDRVYICTGLWYDDGGFYKEGDVLCLNASDGSLIWEYLDCGYCETGPLVLNDILYFTANIVEDDVFDTKGYVYCLDLENGNTIWIRNLDTIRGGVAYEDNRVYVGLSMWCRDDFKKFFCLNASNGDTIWFWDEKNREEIYTSPITLDGKVYVATMGYGYLENGSDVWIPGAVHCFDGLTGELLWESEIGGTFNWCSPAIAYGRLYIGSGIPIVQSEQFLRRGDFFCIDITDGSLIWTHSRLYSLGGLFSIHMGCISPAISDGKVFVGSSDYLWGNFHCLDAFTGKTVWRYRHFGLLGQGYAPSIADGRVFVGFDTFFSSDGWLYCFGDAS